MILLKITNEQLLALKQDVNFAALADSLLSIHGLRTARGNFKPRKDGFIEVDDEYLSFSTLSALNASFGIEVGDLQIYVEVPTTNLDVAIPSYLPDATRTDYIDDLPVEVQNTWGDLVSRTSLDGTQNICSLSKFLPLADLQSLMAESGVTPLNHIDTLARIAADYTEPDVI